MKFKFGDLDETVDIKIDLFNKNNTQTKKEIVIKENTKKIVKANERTKLF